MRVSDPRIFASIIKLSSLARCRGAAIAGVELGNLSTDDGHPADGPRATEAPDGVGACRQLGVEAGDDISARGSAAPDHCVDVVASRCTSRADVDFSPETAFVRVKDKGTDVVTDVQDECVGWPGEGPRVLRRAVPLRFGRRPDRSLVCPFPLVTGRPGGRVGSHLGCYSRHEDRPNRGRPAGSNLVLTVPHR